MAARRGPPVVIEGTPAEIAGRLADVEEGKRITVIIPGEELTPSDHAAPQAAAAGWEDDTIRQIFAPSQAGFDRSGLSDDELSDSIEADVKAYRAERRQRDERAR
jgi:hypothetical protein